MPDEFVTVARAVVTLRRCAGLTKAPADCLVRALQRCAGFTKLREELGREVSFCQKLTELDNIYDRAGTTCRRP
jgi:hypothetical protein